MNIQLHERRLGTNCVLLKVTFIIKSGTEKYLTLSTVFLLFDFNIFLRCGKVETSAFVKLKKAIINFLALN